MKTLHFLEPNIGNDACWSGVGDGWLPLVARLHIELIKLDPTYSVLQVKEKFGTLRFYASSAVDVDKKFSALISDAEKQSGEICEDCGLEGTWRNGGWCRTNCDRCHAELWECRNDGENYPKNAEKIRAETHERNRVIFKELGLTYHC
jgi:hypothetical protein